MKLGVLREIKAEEQRVGLTPDGVASCVAAGHRVCVERGAGIGSGFSDQQYTEAGAKVVSQAQEIFAGCDLIVKVKEPQPEECEQLRPGQMLFTFLHLAAYPALAEKLMASGVTALGYETVTDEQGRLPLLMPMSQVAGRLAVQAGAHYLESTQGGRGVLLGQVAGVARGHVIIVGGGTVGTEAAKVALGLGARVTVLDNSLTRLYELETLLGGRAELELASPQRLRELLPEADLLVGAVLIPGGSAPQILTREDLALMQSGSVVVDVAIDQGGCFATSKATTHREPIYRVDNVIHYCVANIPSAVARTSTIALGQATLPYILELAALGLNGVAEHRGLRQGVNVHAGRITHTNVAAALDKRCEPFD